MDRPDNKVGIPHEHYRALFSALDPHLASERSGVRFYDGAFRLKFLNRSVVLPYPDMSPYYEENGEKLSREAAILFARLVLEGQLIPRRAEKFLAYAETPWGELYKDNFHGRCVLRLTYGFGRDLPRFARICEELGGVKAEAGDTAYDLEFIDSLVLRLIFWAGDEEFPPSAQILFSDNFPAAFMAEDMAVVGDLTINEMKKVKV